MNLRLFRTMNEARSFVDSLKVSPKIKDQTLDLMEESFLIKKHIMKKNNFSHEEFEDYFLSMISPPNLPVGGGMVEQLKASLIAFKNGLISVAEESGYPDINTLAKLAVFTHHSAMEHLNYEDNEEIEHNKQKILT